MSQPVKLSDELICDARLVGEVSQRSLADCGLPFINADEIATALRLGPYEAAEVAANLRNAMLAKRESFIFETVLSDPVGDKARRCRKPARLAEAEGRERLPNFLAPIFLS